MSSPSFSTDGTSIAFLKTIKSISSLVVADTATGTRRTITNPEDAGDSDATLSLEEKLQRERLRQTTQGVNSFIWLPNSSNVVFPRGGSLMIVDTAASATGTASLLFEKASTGADGSALDPKPSPDGSMLAFVQQDELYVLKTTDASTGPAPAVRVTYGAREGGPGLHNGLPDFVIDEEFDRHTGYWWSPCGRYIAFQATDERHVPTFTIQHGEGTDPYGQETHAYPFAGKANPKVRIGVLDVQAALASPGSQSPVTWLNTGSDEDIYVARVEWLPSGMGRTSTTGRPSLFMQVLNRAQTVLDVVVYDTTSGQGQLLLREVPSSFVKDGDSWVNVLGQLAFLSPQAWPVEHLPPMTRHALQALPGQGRGGFMVWGSERTGYAHVYLYALPVEWNGGEYAGPPKTAPRQPKAGQPVEGLGIEEEGADAALPSPPFDPAVWGSAVCLGCVTGNHRSTGVVESVATVAGIPGNNGAGPALYFSGTLDSPLERHLYVVPIFRGDTEEERACPYGVPGMRRLTTGPGIHTVTAVAIPSGGAVLIADVLSSLHCAPSLSLLRFDPSQRFPVSPVRRPIPSKATGSVGSPAGLRSPGMASPGAFSSPGPRSLSPRPGAGSAVKGTPGAFPLSPGLRSPGMGSSMGLGGTNSDLLLPFVSLASGSSVEFKSVSSPIVDVAGQVVSFDRTGWYGGRMSVGVALVAVLSGAVPTGFAGTPDHYEAVRDVIMAASGRASSRRGFSQTSYDDDSSDGPLASVSRALDGIAAAVSTGITSGMSRLDNFGEALAAQLQGTAEKIQGTAAQIRDGAASAVSVPTMHGLQARSRTGSTAGTGSGASTSAPGLSLPSLPSLPKSIPSVSGKMPSMPSLDGITGKISSAASGLGKAVAAPLGSMLRASTESPAPPSDASDSSRAGSPPRKDSSASSGLAVAPSTPVPHTSSSAFAAGFVPTTPAPASLGGADGSSVWTAADGSDEETAANANKTNPAPIIFRLPAADGTTPLFGALYVPDVSVHGTGPWPCILSVYGGPHVQRVKADWALASEARAQALRRDGFLVLAVDNRGSSRRGLAFEATLHRRMGTVEVDDQAAAVRAVIDAGLADGSRVGVYGWSYGGYMTLQCLAQHPGLFHAGVSGAPVVFWEGYDTGYTERYMGTPQDNAEGYNAASVLPRAGSITGRLLLVHGLVDENVHARHSWALVHSLVAAGVPHDTLFLPGERHVVRNPAVKAYMDAKVKDHFHKYLGATMAAPGPVQRVVLPAAAGASPAPSANAVVVDVTPAAATPAPKGSPPKA